MEKSLEAHPFPPLWNAEARVLILGSFPSVKSREAGFFYAHPQNRFWPVLAAVLGAPVPRGREEKAALALSHGVALWDVIGSCEIAGSSDASITGAAANDLRPILRGASIRAIFCNGGTAWRYYQRLCLPVLGRSAGQLPSTSPANARWTADMLTERWAEAILPCLH